MGRILASLVVAAALLSIGTSEASAWVCRATGLGSGGCAVAPDGIVNNPVMVDNTGTGT